MDGWLIFGFIFVVVGVPIFIIFVIPALLDRSEEASHRRFEEEIQEQKKEAERKQQEYEAEQLRQRKQQEYEENIRRQNEFSDLNSKGYYLFPSGITDIANIERMKDAVLQKRENIVNEFTNECERARTSGCGETFGDIYLYCDKYSDFGRWQGYEINDGQKFSSIKSRIKFTTSIPCNYFAMSHGFVIESEEQWIALVVASVEKLHKNNNSRLFTISVNSRGIHIDEVGIFDIPKTDSFI